MTSVALPRLRVQSDAEVYRHRYLIAFAVTLASVLELVDTSIVNVAIPHMMGNLGATLEEVAWVSTGYIVANVIVLPLTSWFSERLGRRNYYTGSIALFTLGQYRRSAPPEDVEAFVNAFKNYAAAAYQSYFAKYTNQSLKVTGSTQRNPTDFIVQTQLVDPSSNQPPGRGCAVSGVRSRPPSCPPRAPSPRRGQRPWAKREKNAKDWP